MPREVGRAATVVRCQVATPRPPCRCIANVLLRWSAQTAPRRKRAAVRGPRGSRFDAAQWAKREPSSSVRHERCTEDGGLGARVTERACGAATPSFPIAAEPPSLRRDRRRKDGASRRPSNSSSCGSESLRRWCARRPRRSLAGACLADQPAEQAVIAAEADDRDGLGRAPAKEPATAGAIGEAAALAPVQLTRQPPVPSGGLCAAGLSIHTSDDLPRPDSVQTASRQRPDSVQTASRQQNRSV